MKEITAEEKDRVLEWFYEADVKANELPQDVLPDHSQEICSILTSDGYITNGVYRSVLTLKGQSFVLNGGYVKERDEKNRTFKLAEEANKIAKQAKRQSFFSNVIALIAIFVTFYLGITNNNLGSNPNTVNISGEDSILPNTINEKKDSIITPLETISFSNNHNPKQKDSR